MLFFVVDYHALTTNYEHSETIDQFSYDTVVDWLSAGVNPGAATLFVQGTVPEHAELHLMLSMITPLTWLERVPSYKDQQQNLSIGDAERLFGYLEGGGRTILSEPQSMLTAQPKMLGLDGEKMSKSCNNTIGLREEPAVIEEKIRTMQTDPARVRRNDPGNPAQCPVFALHEVYSDDVKQWVIEGCERAGIGCVDCKKPLIDAINSEQEVIRQRACSLKKTQTWFIRLSPRGLKKPAHWLAKPWKNSKCRWYWRPLMSTRFWRDTVYG